jgi:excisionase family DNA binding protein
MPDSSPPRTRTEIRARHNGKKAIDLKAAEQLTGITRRTLRRRIAEGKLPAWRAGPRQIRVYVEDLDKLFTVMGGGG